MSSPTARKRKDDALESGEDDDPKSPAAPTDSPAHLPAPCLAAVLSFLWYTDVRRCMLTGKLMAVEAARHVETLNITEVSELVVPAARRFTNVSEVNMLSRISRGLNSQQTKESKSNSLLNVATRIVPFLGSIPNLEKAYIGTLTPYMGTPDGSRGVSNGPSETTWFRKAYEIDVFDRNDPKIPELKTLMENLCGGFESRALNQNLKLRGILEGLLLGCAKHEGKEDPSRPCHCCRRILSCFPFTMLIPELSDPRTFCVRIIDRIRAVIGRDGAGAALRTNAGAEMLLECLDFEVLPRMVWNSRGDQIDEAFKEKMVGQGAFCYPSGVILMAWGASPNSMDESLEEYLDIVQSFSLQEVLKDIPRSSIESSIAFGKKGNDKKKIFARTILDKLVAAGLNLDANDYIIVDPEKEPALQRLL